MREWIAGVSAALLVTTGIALAAPAGRLAPKDIETTFFNGQPFIAATTSGNLKFKMVFSADGTMTRELMGKTGAKSEGTWKLSQDGFCTTWKGSKQNCFQLRSIAANRWSVVTGTTAVAYWSK